MIRALHLLPAALAAGSILVLLAACATTESRERAAYARATSGQLYVTGSRIPVAVDARTGRPVDAPPVRVVPGAQAVEHRRPPDLDRPAVSSTIRH